MSSRWTTFKLHRRAWRRSLGLGFAFAFLGGTVGACIFVLVTSIMTGPTLGILPVAFVAVPILGLTFGAGLAAPLTVVRFPLLYFLWPSRGYVGFFLVLTISGAGGFASPFVAYPSNLHSLIDRVYITTECNLTPDWVTRTIRETANPPKTCHYRFHQQGIRIGLLGMISALIITPFYYFATRRQDDHKEPPLEQSADAIQGR